jgi:hypothetical protein
LIEHGLIRIPACLTSEELFSRTPASENHLVTNWLKVIGASWHPIQDAWTVEGRFLLSAATFARRCSWEPGDSFAYHALSEARSRVVAVGDVLSSCRYDPSVDQFEFDFVCDVAIRKKVDHVSEGVPLEALNVPGSRDLRRSIMQKGNIRLTDEEFEQARTALGA